MQRIAAPMVGGMLTAPLLSLFVLPAWYALRWRQHVNRRAEDYSRGRQRAVPLHNSPDQRRQSEDI